jgi:hypothetical protein
MPKLAPLVLAIVFLSAAARPFEPPSQPAAPPNEAADLRIEGSSVQLRYHGTLIFDGRIVNPDVLRATNPIVVRTGEAVDQVVSFSAQGGKRLELSATISGSDEAFACESDRPVRALPVVRHSSGASRSLLNQAVYDRRWDWVVSIDDPRRTEVRIAPSTDASGPGARTFGLQARGSEIVLRFRPRFYQKHRGLRFFEPWTFRAWQKPIVGWCSWFAFFDRVTEQDIRRTTDVIADVLAPYGYEYVQMDDGYQRGTGLPELWLKPNEKFPGGLEALAAYVRSKGLKPGIWTNAAFSQTAFAEQHKDWFVLDRAGGVAKGNWIDHPLDASVRAALDAIVRPTFRGLKSAGWEYFKLDALRHLRYEGYNTFRDYFDRKRVEPAEALRRYVSAAREEIGNDTFLLACWGVRPELTGLVDGCRIGTDGFSYAGLAQYNSFNNVVWRNDPDHIELSEAEAWRSTMVTSLTGSLFLLTDKPERYRTPIVEPAKRAAPVLVTVPGQLYDVDASRSSEIARVDAEVSGRDPKRFDAGLTPSVHLYLLEVNRPFESWVVLGRTGGRFDEIPFAELGLDRAKEYLVFEFWQKKYLGTYSGGFAPADLPAPFNSQAFVIRERLPRPQIVATGRHLTGGGVDLLEVGWQEGVLRGRSEIVVGEAYELYVTEPPGWRVSEVSCSQGTPLPIERTGIIAKAGCRVDVPAGSARTGELGWQVRFAR